MGQDSKLKTVEVKYWYFFLTMPTHRETTPHSTQPLDKHATLLHLKEYDTKIEPLEKKYVN